MLFRSKLQIPNAERIFWLQTAFVNGWTLEEIFDATQIDQWFLRHLQQIAQEGEQLASLDLKRAKKLGFSDRQIAMAKGTSEDEIRAQRKAKGIVPGYRLVDTCAAEFEAYTPYYYSTYERPATTVGCGTRGPASAPTAPTAPRSRSTIPTPPTCRLWTRTSFLLPSTA